MNKLLLSLLVFSFSSFAFTSEFCGRRQPDIKSLLMNESSRISFKNTGGFLNKGVCWWHNRFQRSSAYLLKFNPEGTRPDKTQVRRILQSLMLMNRVVEVSGYSDLETFSRDYKSEIQSVLNQWQKIDGIINFQWLRGISGRSELGMHQMQERMDDVFKHYRSSPVPVWVMAQIKGITSHSFLILNMEKRMNGYDLDVIDSNKPMETIRIEYYHGDKNLRPPGVRYTFVPYVGFQNDFRKISKALKQHCPQKENDFDFQVEDGEVERY